MDDAAVTKYITETFPGLAVTTTGSGTFFTYDPEGKLPADRWWPFATIVTSDEYDSFSNLARPDVFRLNVGVSKATYQSLFAVDAPEPDFTALDQFLPHPVYGKMYWVSVLNPGQATWETTRDLLAEAYETAVNRYASV